MEPSKGYQARGSLRLIGCDKIPLFGRMGSGKTRILIDALQGSDDYTGQPTLIVCGSNSIGTWLYELEQWYTGELTDEDIVVARGTPLKRKEIWNNRSRYKFIIVTYGTALRDWLHIINRRWYCIIADEAHKWRNRRTRTFKCVRNLCIHADRFYPATGTSMRKGPQHLYTYLNLCWPKIFKSYWKFVNAFCDVSDTGHGREILGPRNLEALGALLTKYAVFLPDEEVEKELPAGSRIQLYVEPSDMQKELYHQVTEDMLAVIDDPNGSVIMAAPTILAKITRLRQLLVCPKLWFPNIDDYGAAISFVAERLEDDPHAAIFIPFAEAIPYMIDFLHRSGFTNVFSMQGGLKSSKQMETIRLFEETRGIMVCSVLYAESFSLNTCSQAYFIGSDWSWDVNEQAEGRIRRRSSKHDHAYWYYVTHSNTLEEFVVKENLNANFSNVQRVLRNTAALKQVIQGESHG